MTPSPESPDKHHGDVAGRYGRALAVTRRTWQAHWRLILSWAGVVVLLVAVAGQLLPSRAPEQAPTAKAPYAVLVGIAGLRWSDIDADRTPTLWTLTEQGSVGSLAAESAAGTTCPLDGWLTLSAGAPASGKVTMDDGNCPPVSGSTIEPEAEGDGVIVTDQEDLADRNRAEFQGAEVGALPAAVRCASAIGPGAAHAASRPTGRLDFYREALPEDPDELAAFLSECTLTVVDLGTLSIDPRERAAELAVVDAAMAAITEAMPADALLLTAGIADTSSAAHLHAVVATGGGFDGGWLTSVGIGREGYLRLIDLAPTVVAALDRPLPRPFVGAPVGVVPDRHESVATTVAELSDVDDEAAGQEDAISPLLLVLTLAVLVLFALTAPILQRIRRGAGPVGRRRPTVWTLRAIVAAAAALALTLPAATLVDVVPWWRSDRPMLALFGATVLFVAIMTALVLLVPKRRSPMGLMITVSIVGLCVVAADILTGGRLQFDGIAAYSTLNSAGNAGLGPLGYGVFVTSLLMVVGCAVQLAPRMWRPLLIAVVGSVGVLIVGSPYLGDDPGGAVALTVGVCLACGISTGGWLTFARFAWASFAGFGLLVALAVADAARPEAQRGPLGGFVSDIFGGDGGGRVRATLESDVVAVISNPMTLLLLGSAVFCWLVLLQPSGGLKRTFGLYPSVRAAFVGAIVSALLGGLLSGNGFIPMGAAAAITMPLAIIMSLRVLARAQVRDGSESIEDRQPVMSA